jgi:hypothetical protein
MRRMRLAGVVVAILVLGGCRMPWSTADDAAKWFPKAEKALSESHGATAFKGIKLGDEAERGRFGGLVREGQGLKLNAKETEALNRLSRLSEYYTAAQEAARVAVNRWSESQTIVEGVVQSSIYTGAKPSQSFADHLVEHGQAILKDAVCDLAWSMMNSDEATTIKVDLVGRGYIPPPDEVPGLESMTREAAVGAIKSRAIQAAAALGFQFPERVVEWGAYAAGLYDKASGMVEDGVATIPYPNGAPVTRAYIYYFNICLRPPGG